MSSEEVIGGHSVLVLFLTQTKSSEAETFFSISYDAKQVRISWENHLSTGFPLSYSTKSIITVARAVQNLGRNGLLQAGRFSNGQNFFIKLAQTCDKQMVKISERYLKPLLSNSKSTKFCCWPLPTKWAFCTFGCLKWPFGWQRSTTKFGWFWITQKWFEILSPNFYHIKYLYNVNFSPNVKFIAALKMDNPPKPF